MIAAVTHPSAESLRRFARGEASREESRQVVAHLLGRCTTCRRVVSGAARLAAPRDRE
jgi:anti-sigma factor ChrR (cupin superfamily)